MGYLTLRLANDRKEPVQFAGYKFNSLWPLEEGSPRWQFVLQYTGIVLNLLAFFLTLYGEYTFFFQTADDIPAMTDCLSTSFEGIQFLIRISLMVVRQNAMRKIFKRFDREICFTISDDAKFRRDTEQCMRVPDFFTKFYYMIMLTLAGLFLLEAIQFDIHSNDKPYICRMTITWYNPQEPVAYVFTSIYSTWLVLSCVGLWSAEDYTICLMLCHTSFRMKQLHEDLLNLYEESIAGIRKESANAEVIHAAYRLKLKAILKRQQRIMSFVAHAKKYFTFLIFLSMMFGTLCICVVMFQFQRIDVGPDWMKYIVWLISQMSQVIVNGYFGQMLTDSAKQLENSFYMCGWENILQFGTAHTNKLLMKDIRFAIMNAQKEVVFYGLKLVPLTHGTVGGALRSAMSYFMFLNTMDDLKNV